MIAFTSTTITNALVDLPTVLIVCLLALCWIILFGCHLTKPHIRIWAGKLLICVSLLIGMLAPLMFSYNMFELHGPSVIDGSADPSITIANIRSSALSAVYIGGFAVTSFLLSSWAWLLPCAEFRDPSKKKNQTEQVVASNL